MKFLNAMEFLKDWWNKITIWIHELPQVAKICIIAVLGIAAIACLSGFIKPQYNADKNKLKVKPLIGFLIFGALALFFAFI